MRASSIRSATFIVTDTYTDFDYERRGGFGSTAAGRLPFEIDKGRVIHSAAFRRLQGKTQVLQTGEGDFFRTRLTHSLEVAQLGRGLCRELDRELEPDQDLVEVICLGHDIGHPPFGHSGEELLNGRMREYGGFGANPQNLRIVTALEAKFMDFGVDLTRATLDGLVKYPTLFETPSTHAKFTYAEDRELLEWIKEGVCAVFSLPLEAQIADWADQMAYSVNDIEDSLRAGILLPGAMRVRKEEIRNSAARMFEKQMKRRGRSSEFPEDVAGSIAVSKLADELEERYIRPIKIHQRKINLKEWTSFAIKSLKVGCRIVRSDPNEISVRYRYRLELSDEAIALAAMLQSIGRLLVFSDSRVTQIEEDGCRIVAEIFDHLVQHSDLLPEDFRELYTTGKYGSLHRVVCDFVSGMTDQYARIFHYRFCARRS